MNRYRTTTVLSTLFMIFCLADLCALSEEHRSSIRLPTIPATNLGSTGLGDGFWFSWESLTIGDLSTPIEMPRRSRVTRSNRPLRQITLVADDRFLAECLDWGTDTASFRLLNHEIIQVPIRAIASMANPPGEVELIDEWFGQESSIPRHADKTDRRNEVPVGEGRRSLRIVPSSAGFRREFAPQASARIEFSFRAIASDLTAPCGEWLLEFEDDQARSTPLTVRVGADRRISVTGIPAGVDATIQSLTLSADWHSFIALISPERSWLIVDDANLASFVSPNSPVRAIQFRPGSATSKNGLDINGLQVRGRVPIDEGDQWTKVSHDNDLIRFHSGDELFGPLRGLDRNSVVIEAFGTQQAFPWSRIAGLVWKQPSTAVQQTIKPVTGIVSILEMQPFVDRRECEPERWSATVVRVDSEQVIALHSLIGEMSIQWPQIRRITPQFSGQTLLVDGRRFHLGNSIRTDFHRQEPDGTRVEANLFLREIPRGKAVLSLDVSELEAAAPNAPPGSPFLEDLHAGRLVTEVFVNDHREGNLNSLLRFKATTRSPDRLRLAVARHHLKIGDNRIRLQQKPLKESDGEFDDCEVGNIRLEFDMKE